MKKLFFLAVFAMVLIGCTADELPLENEKSTVIEPEKDCPEIDRNCNGIPDEDE